jgi:hypothetical protein
MKKLNHSLKAFVLGLGIALAQGAQAQAVPQPDDCGCTRNYSNCMFWTSNSLEQCAYMRNLCEIGCANQP